MQKKSSKNTSRRTKRPVATATSAARATAEKQRVTEAVHELLHNPQTPGDLWERVAEFITEALNNKGNGDDLHHTKPMLSLILDACSTTESRSAVIAARKEGE